MTEEKATYTAITQERPWHLPTYSTEKPTVTVHKDAIMDRQGKDFVLYWGLLDAAHRAGLQSIHTTFIQAPTPQNGETCVCYAEAVFPWGSYTGIGDANPGNTSRNIAPHAIRMAETRAKARALRDALNIKMVAVEEIGLDDPDYNRAAHPPEGGRSGGSGGDDLKITTTHTGEGVGTTAPRRVATPPPPTRSEQPAPAPARSVPTGGDGDAVESLAKYERLKATYTRLSDAGKLAAEDDLVAPFAPGTRAVEIEARCQRLLNKINGAVQRTTK